MGRKRIIFIFDTQFWFITLSFHFGASGRFRCYADPTGWPIRHTRVGVTPREKHTEFGLRYLKKRLACVEFHP